MADQGGPGSLRVASGAFHVGSTASEQYARASDISLSGRDALPVSAAVWRRCSGLGEVIYWQWMIHEAFQLSEDRRAKPCASSIFRAPSFVISLKSAYDYHLSTSSTPRVPIELTKATCFQLSSTIRLDLSLPNARYRGQNSPNDQNGERRPG